MDSDSMHGVVEVAFGVPAGNNHWLRVSLVVGSAGPDFVIAFAGELKADCPTLPCVTVGCGRQGCGMPTGAEVEADVHLLYTAGSAPGFASDFKRGANECICAGFGVGDHRFDGHERDDFHVCFGNGFSGGDGMLGHSVGRAGHFGAVVDAVTDPKAADPLAASGAWPAGTKDPQGKTVFGGERFSVHFPSEQSVRVEGFLDGNSARDGVAFGIAAEVGVFSVVGDVVCGVFEASGVQDVDQANSAVAGASDCA